MRCVPRQSLGTSEVVASGAVTRQFHRYHVVLRLAIHELVDRINAGFGGAPVDFDDDFAFTAADLVCGVRPGLRFLKIIIKGKDHMRGVMS